MNQHDKHNNLHVNTGFKLTLFDDCFSSDVVHRKHGIKNITKGAE